MFVLFLTGDKSLTFSEKKTTHTHTQLPIANLQLCPRARARGIEQMGLLPLLVPPGPGQASSVKALLRAGSRAAGSARMLSATKQACGHPHLGVTALYVDRGVIVVNKPPGLVSQGSTAMATAPRSTAPAAPALLAGAAFNDVLDGTNILHTIRTTFSVLGGPKSNRAVSFFFFSGLRRMFDLGENPYPVHRLDKVCTVRGVKRLRRDSGHALELPCGSPPSIA